MSLAVSPGVHGGGPTVQAGSTDMAPWPAGLPTPQSVSDVSGLECGLATPSCLGLCRKPLRRRILSASCAA